MHLGHVHLKDLCSEQGGDVVAAELDEEHEGQARQDGAVEHELELDLRGQGRLALAFLEIICYCFKTKAPDMKYQPDNVLIRSKPDHGSGQVASLESLVAAELVVGCGVASLY